MRWYVYTTSHTNKQIGSTWAVELAFAKLAEAVEYTDYTYVCVCVCVCVYFVAEDNYYYLE